VANPEHPEHADLLNVLSAPELDDPIVNLGSARESRKRPTVPA